MNVFESLFKRRQAALGLAHFAIPAHQFQRKRCMIRGIGAKIRDRTLQAMRRPLQRFGIARGHRGADLGHQRRIFLEEKLSNLPKKFFVATKPLQRHGTIQASKLRCELHRRLLGTRPTFNGRESPAPTTSFRPLDLIFEHIRHEHKPHSNQTLTDGEWSA